MLKLGDCQPDPAKRAPARASHDAVDVLQQRIDGGPAPRRIRPGPPIRAEACTRLPFRLFSEVVHRFVDNRGACAFGDGVPSAQDPRRPCVVALEYRRGGERDQRVHERELVMELPDVCEAFTHQRDRLIGRSRAAPPGWREDTASSVRNHGPACRSTDVASSSRRSAWPTSPVARATAAIPLSAFPVPHGIASASEPFDAAGKPVAGRVQVASGVFDVPEQILSLRDHLHVAGAVGERQGAR